jgi:hypothetical protein
LNGLSSSRGGYRSGAATSAIVGFALSARRARRARNRSERASGAVFLQGVLLLCEGELVEILQSGVVWAESLYLGIFTESGGRKSRSGIRRGCLGRGIPM